MRVSLFIGVFSYPDRFSFDATRSAQVRDVRSANVLPYSELVDSGASIGVGSSYNLTTTSGGIPTSRS